jgi:hypothetical protein
MKLIPKLHQFKPVEGRRAEDFNFGATVEVTKGYCFGNRNVSSRKMNSSINREQPLDKGIITLAAIITLIGLLVAIDSLWFVFSWKNMGNLLHG